MVGLCSLAYLNKALANETVAARVSATHWTVNLPAQPQGQVHVSILCRDCDTVGEAMVIYNDVNYDPSRTWTQANDYDRCLALVPRPPGCGVAQISFDTLATDWHVGTGNVIDFLFLRKPSSYIVDTITLTYATTAPVLVTFSCRSGYRAGYGGPLGRAYTGCERSDTLGKTTFYKDVDIPGAQILAFAQAIVRRADISPRPVNPWIQATSSCDIAWLWAKDDLAAPAMTRAVKIAQACSN